MKNLMMVVFILIQAVTTVYCMDKILDDKTNYKSIKNILLICLLVLLTRINWIYNNSYITMIFSITIIAFCNYYLRENKRLTEIVSATFVYFLINIVSEVICSSLLLLFQSKEQIIVLTSNEIYKNMISSAIFFITTLVVQIPFIKTIYKKTFSIIDKTKIINILAAIFLFIVAFNLSYILIYYSSNTLLRLLVNSFFMCIYLLILVKSLNIKVKYKEVSDKYTNTIRALKEYEKMMDFYKVNNHENKNNFLTIRNMLSEDDEKIKNFIDNIIDNRIMDDEKLNMESSNIPEGGIRAVIYSKLLEMKNKKIKFDLETDFKIRRFNLENTKAKTMLDICNILGVFLDNAIHASADMGDKAYVKVTLTMKDDDLCISIKNKFNGTIDVEKIDKVGYSTKGSGHGYGLSLVKNILVENRNLINKRKLTKNTFEQILIIKNKQN